MKSKDRDPETILDQVLSETRAASMDAAQVEAAASRVWTNLTQEFHDHTSTPQEHAATPPESSRIEPIRSCSDFQALIPAYVSGHLAESRALLLEDHTRECVPCRKALRAVRSGTSSVEPPPASTGPVQGHSYKRRLAWAIAAAVLIGVALQQLGMFKAFFLSGDVRAVVQTVEGTIVRVSGQEIQPITAGATVNQRERIRTARDSMATLQLADGSRIEMKERSELFLTAGRDGANIQLERGSVIVSAAKRRSGHLYLSTPDCLVSVTGTVFSVDRGAKGSRVSVIEGEVWVEQGKNRKALHSGEQLATHPSLGAVPLEQEIAWSKNVDSHVALLRALSAARKELDGRTSGPGLRYTSTLLNLVPEGTVVYAAFPNISATLGQAYDMFRQRIDENAELRRWWSEAAQLSVGKPGLDEIIAKIRTFSDFLGDEIVMAVPMNRTRAYAEPLLLAEVRRSDGLLAFLHTEAARLKADSGNGPALRIIANPADLAARSDTQRPGHELILLVYNNILAASPSAAQLETVVAQQQNPGSSRFPQTGFYSRIAGAYSDGVGWLFAADLERVFPAGLQEHRKPSDARRESELFHRLGISDINQLLVEQKSVAGQTENRAVLTFNQPRRGMAAWLAQPGPMGSLDFVSPDAVAVAAFVAKEPVMIVDDLFGLLQASDSAAWQRLSEFESQRGVSIRADVAAPLGGEFLVAVDGPLLPTPAWKVVAEVYDAARLQKTLEWAVTELNRLATESGNPGVSLTGETFDGRVFYKLASPASSYEVHYVFWDGYLLAAPSRALLVQSIQYRATGYTLPKSSAFRAQLPTDGRAHCSALFYQNLLPTVGSVAKYLPRTGTPLSSDQVTALQELGAGASPTLIGIYGEKDRIVLASRGDLALNLGMKMSALAGFDSLRKIMSGAPR